MELHELPQHPFTLFFVVHIHPQVTGTLFVVPQRHGQLPVVRPVHDLFDDLPAGKLGGAHVAVAGKVVAGLDMIVVRRDRHALYPPAGRRVLHDLVAIGTLHGAVGDQVECLTPAATQKHELVPVRDGKWCDVG